MNKAILSILFLFVGYAVSLAQEGQVYGHVFGDHNEKLIGVKIFDKTTKYQTSTDNNGFYELDLPANVTFEIVFHYLGEQKTITVNLKNDQIKQLDVVLKTTVEIESADIIGIRERGKTITKIDPRIASQIPSPQAGIEAVLRVAPVNMNNELSSAYSVRGGSFDENLVYVNGIQVYRPFLVRAGEQEGLSFPNPDMVENITFSAGGFEAKYGDRLSSVLDIKYKNPTEFSGSTSMSLLGGSVQVGDRIETRKKKEDQGYISYNLGFRVKSNAYLLGSLDTKGDYNPRFIDVQSYIIWKPKEYSPFEINFLGNYSQNRYHFVPQSRQTDVGNINEALRFSVDFEGAEESDFETFFGALSLKYFASENTLLRLVTSTFKTYENENFDIFGRYRLDELERDFGSDDFGEVLRNRGVGAFRNHARNELDATVFNVNHIGSSQINKKNYVEWGVKYQVEKINDKLSEWSLIDSAGYSSTRPDDNLGYGDGERPFQEIAIQDVIKASNNISSNRITGYLQNTNVFKRSNKTKIEVNYGLRGHYWDFNEEFVGGPRANASFHPKWYKNKIKADTNLVDIVFSLASGYYFQPAFYKEMRGLQGEVNEDIRAQQAIHFVGGVNYLFKAWNRPFIVKTEIYYKKLSKLIPYEVENVRQRYYATNNSNGYATGIDVMLNGEFIDGIESWVRASVLKTEEDLTDDFYYEYTNTDGEIIVPGYTLNRDVADSSIKYPGYIPRPTDQRFSFSLLFKDEMKKWPEYKVLVSLYYSSGLPYGPPSFERYKDVNRAPAYRRVDIGFSKDLFVKRNKKIDDGEIILNKKGQTKNHLIKKGWISLEVFNLLDISNTINYSWIEDVNGRQYGIANHLTGRRINVKLHFDF